MPVRSIDPARVEVMRGDSSRNWRRLSLTYGLPLGLDASLGQPVPLLRLHLP